jgi:uncharacterized repeat protein (TIGR01451 family)
LGQAVGYTILVSNTGNLTATGLVLSDHLPGTLTLISGTLQVGGSSLFTPLGSVLVWRGALPPGQEFRLTCILSATASTPLGEWLTNTAWLVADGIAPLTRQAAIAYHHFIYLPLLSKNAVTVPQ